MHPGYEGCVTKNHKFLVLAASTLTTLFLSLSGMARSLVTFEERLTVVGPSILEQEVSIVKDRIRL